MSTATVELVGERILRLRDERGISQRELGGGSVSGAYVSKVEHGERQPSVRALRAFAARMGVDPFYLEHGSDPYIVLADGVDGEEFALGPFVEETAGDYAELLGGRTLKLEGPRS